MSSIYVIDDDVAMDILSDAFRYRGHSAERIPSVGEAISRLDDLINSDLVILDVIMPLDVDGYNTYSSISYHNAGMEVFRQLRAVNNNLPIIVYSATQDLTITESIEDDPHAIFISMWDGVSIKEIVAEAYKLLNIPLPLDLPQVFIVHGHNDKEKLSLKNYLQNTLGLPEPVILHEQPDSGRTIIEKFEDCAETSSFIFVILTPDDSLASDDDTNAVKYHARQNVILELGYFLGLYGRRSGRVILLFKPPLDIPSDLSGIVYIDITNGIESVGERIRKELSGNVHC